MATARALASKNAHVVMAARNQSKASTAAVSIRAEHPGASLEIVELDLGWLDSVRAAAATISKAHPSVEILVNNAGLMAMPEGRTADGFETQFGVNHLGHWALTALLMPSILAANRARVVTVTSAARHLATSIDYDDPHLTGRYEPWKAYNQSKLANYYFALGLQKQFDEDGVPTALSLVAHPGFSNTDLQSTTVAEGGGGPAGEFFHRFISRFGMSADAGALSQIRAATDPAARGGQLYAPRFVINGPPVRRPILRRPGLDKAIDQLWELSERETGIQLRTDT